MRNSIIFLLITVFAVFTASAQVKIGDNPQNIDPSSVLELESTDKVLVITRVTTAQMNAIVPSQGALCYNTDLQSVHYYDGTQWVNIGGSVEAGGPLTADPIVNPQATIVITPTATGDNLEVAPNSIRSEQIVDGGINGVDIQDGSIGPGKLQAGAITIDALSENSVGLRELDNTRINLSDFVNDVPFISAADITTVSADAGNSIIAGSDGGAFYDDTNLLMDVVDNAAAIAADDDQSSTNEIQTLSIVGNQLSISDGNTIALPAGSAADGSETIINSTATVTVNGTGTALDPYELTAAGGGTGTTEVVDNTTLTGLGTGADPFKIEPGAVGQILTTDATGVVWSTVTPGGGSTEEADQTTITGIGTNTDPFKIEPSATNGQYLRTNASGDVVWDDLPPSGATALFDPNTISGTGVAGDEYTVADNGITTPKILDANVTPAKIEPSATVNQVLTTTAAGAVWADLPPSGATALFDPNTISGTGVAGDEYTVADNGITTLKILDANVTPAKIEPGAADQILRTATDGLSVAWVDLPTGGAVFTDATLTGDGSSAATELSLADEAVTLEKINQNGATNGQVLKWNDDAISPGVGGWETGDAAANEQSIALDVATNQIDLLNDDATINSSVKLDGTTIEAFDNGTDNVLQLADEAVTLEKINQNGATNGQVLKWNDDAISAGVGGWETGDASPHVGELNSVFFADGTTGEPTTSINPEDELSFVWDQAARLGYGQLQIGLDGNIAPEAVSKVVIAETLSGGDVMYPLLIQTSAPFNADASTGILFSPEVDALNTLAKGALIYQRTGDWATGDFHFLQNSQTGGRAQGILTPTTAADKAFTVKNNKDIVIYGGIEVDGTGAGTGLGGAGQVLSSTGTGVQWVDSNSIGTDNQDASEVNLVTPVDIDGDLTDETTVEDAIAKIAAIGVGENLENTNLTQSATDLVRTYEITNATQSLVFTGLGNVGVGNGANPPQNKLHVSGAIRSEAILNSNGDRNEPSYRFSGDIDTGMFSRAADEIGFSVGTVEAASIQEASGTSNVIINQSLELDGQLLDITNNTGTDGQLLSSTTTAGLKTVTWVDAPDGATQKGKITAATGTAGLYTEPVTGQTTANYIISLAVEENTPGNPIMIQVTNQTISDFTVQIYEFNGGTFNPTNANWHYTIYNP